jgi:hypothetical protein
MIETTNYSLTYNLQETNYMTKTQEDLQKEVDYWQSRKILKKMLEVGLISDEEFAQIDKLNLKTFLPMYAQIMA